MSAVLAAPRVPDSPSSINVDHLPSVNPNILQLEQKPATVLAHDAGAGAPCLRCHDRCPGLDLHFWRKICRSCLCRKEDHDLPAGGPDPGTLRIGKLFDSPLALQLQSSLQLVDDEQPQQLLSSAGRVKATAAALEHNHSPHSNYDWLPQPPKGTTPTQSRSGWPSSGFTQDRQGATTHSHHPHSVLSLLLYLVLFKLPMRPLSCFCDPLCMHNSRGWSGETRSCMPGGKGVVSVNERSVDRAGGGNLGRRAGGEEDGVGKGRKWWEEAVAVWRE